MDELRAMDDALLANPFRIGTVFNQQRSLKLRSQKLGQGLASSNTPSVAFSHTLVFPCQSACIRYVGSRAAHLYLSAAPPGRVGHAKPPETFLGAVGHLPLLRPGEHSAEGISLLSGNPILSWLGSSASGFLYP